MQSASTKEWKEEEEEDGFSKMRYFLLVCWIIEKL